VYLSLLINNINGPGGACFGTGSKPQETSMSGIRGQPNDGTIGGPVPAPKIKEGGTFFRLP